MVPGILAAGIHPINVFISQMLASQLPKGAQTVLVQSNLLGELVLGLFAVSVATVSLPAMSRQAAEGDLDGVRHSLATALRGTAFMAIPASVGLAVLASPIVALIYRTGRFDAEAVRWTAGTLAFQAIGLLFIASARISTQALNAMKDYRGPAIAAVLALVSNIVLSILLMKPLGTAGMALANSLSAMIGLSFQEWRLRRVLQTLPYREVITAWIAMAFASLLMGALAMFGGRLIDAFTFHGVFGTSLRLFPLILSCSAFYFAVMLMLKVPEAKDLLALAKRKLIRSGPGMNGDERG
jgi:putative peptidoglycan lipid II flippase